MGSRNVVREAAEDFQKRLVEMLQSERMEPVGRGTKRRTGSRSDAKNQWQGRPEIQLRRSAAAVEL